MLYTAKAFHKLNREQIARKITEAGFNPILISDRPGFCYPTHDHPETKLLVFLEGSMTVTVGGKILSCEPGDKLLIPGNTPHSAVAGPEGCTFFWSEKLM